jgi:hypothetical protein
MPSIDPITRNRPAAVTVRELASCLFDLLGLPLQIGGDVAPGLRAAPVASVVGRCRLTRMTKSPT